MRLAWAPRSVVLFEHPDVRAGVDEVAGCCETADPRADDRDASPVDVTTAVATGPKHVGTHRRTVAPARSNTRSRTIRGDDPLTVAAGR